MTPEKQQIAIAGACGWTRLDRPEPLLWKRDGQTHIVGYAPWRGPDTRLKQEEDLPDYLNDRNAMVEALKTLTPRQREVFASVLTYPTDSVPGDQSYIGYIEIPASDVFDLLIADTTLLAKTFLLTLNLWVED